MLQFIDKCRRCKKDMNDMPATRYEERSKKLWFMYLQNILTQCKEKFTKMKKSCTKPNTQPLCPMIIVFED